MKIFAWRNCAAVIGLLCTAVATPLPAAAQYPNAPVRMVVPVGPGGGTDLMARQLAAKLSETWGQQVIVENKNGGAGTIAAATVTSSAPNGYTLFFTHDGVITATPVLYKRPDFDPGKQLVPIARVAKAAYVFVVNPAVPVKTVSELIALMKKRAAEGQPMTFATSALGSADHLSGETFKKVAGVEMVVVPFKESLPAMTNVIGGHMPMGFFTVPPTQGHVMNGALRAIGVTSKERLVALPDTPTFGETLPGFETGAWYGVFAPAGTPQALIDKISADIVKIVNSPDMAAYIIKASFISAPQGAAEFADFVKSDSAKTADVIKSANVKVE